MSEPSGPAAVRVSVIVVTWNSLEMTAACLESLFANLGSVAADVIVVDNASADGSAAELPRRFPALRVIANSTNLGFATANNQALRSARGDYFLLLNSDTLVRGDVIARSLRYLDEHPRVGVMGCRVLNTDGTLQLSCSREPDLVNIALLTSGLDRLPWPRWLGRYQMRHWTRDDERDVDVVSGCYMLVRRSALDEVGLLDESFFFFGEETDWCQRFRARGWAVRFAPVGEIVHHGSASAVKLEEGRSLLLTDALCRLQRKHHGVLPALAMWLLLFAFNVSRAAGYALRALALRRPEDAQRARFFGRVVASMGGSLRTAVAPRD